MKDARRDIRGRWLLAAAFAGTLLIAGSAPAFGRSLADATADTTDPGKAAPVTPLPAAPAPALPPASPPGPAPAPPPASSAPPATAAAALEKVRAAYEYGDMEMVADEARAVADGRVRPTPAQRAQALRYLGIALFLTGRTEGAETAFFDLLRLRPSVRLDPTNTRPDVVTFFEGVRARHADEIRRAADAAPGKRFIWNLLPPAGQFQNGHTGRGWTIAVIEVISLGASIASYAQLRAWEDPNGHTFGDHTSDARAVKALNYLSAGVFATTVILGIIDGVNNYKTDTTESSLALTPNGFVLRF